MAFYWHKRGGFMKNAHVTREPSHTRLPKEWWMSEDGVILITSWRRDGMLVKDVAAKIGISESTLHAWCKENPQLKDILAMSKELANYKVENALLKRALGFTSTEIKVTLGKKIVGGEMFQVLEEKTTKQVAPDVTACLAWLNNKNFDVWKRNRDKCVEPTEEDRKVNITIVRGNGSDEVLGSETNQGVNIQIGGSGKKPDNGRDPSLDVWPEDWEDEE